MTGGQLLALLACLPVMVAANVWVHVGRWADTGRSWSYAVPGPVQLVDVPSLKTQVMSIGAAVTVTLTPGTATVDW